MPIVVTSIIVGSAMVVHMVEEKTHVLSVTIAATVGENMTAQSVTFVNINITDCLVRFAIAVSTVIELTTVQNVMDVGMVEKSHPVQSVVAASMVNENTIVRYVEAVHMAK